MRKVTLTAASLLSKFGFQDGDLFDDIADGNSHLFLETVVRDKLLPLLPGVELDVYTTIHNPVRATDETRHLVDESVEVTVYIDEETLRFCEVNQMKSQNVKSITSGLFN